MARQTAHYDERCRCKHGCPTHAWITKWSCACVQVKVLNDRAPGYDCTDFSGQRNNCGQRGDPAHHRD